MGMDKLNKILKSFYIQDNLNPKFWGSSNGENMNEKVRERLLEIANDFIDFLDVDILISDVVMTGSLCNYNWSDYSDVDIHILVDFNQFSSEEKPLYDELFYLKKSVYNNKHDITIFGYDVELYVEDESSVKEVKGIGIYSLLNDEWKSKPSKESVEIDFDGILSKAKQWMVIIDNVIKHTKDEEIESAKGIIKKCVDKIRKYRERGLQKGGEYSEENMVFKILRRNGYLEKIRTLKDKLIDKKLSLKEGLNSDLDNDEDLTPKINDLIKNDPKLKYKNFDELIEMSKQSNFLKSLIKLIKPESNYKNLKSPKSKIPYDKGVEIIQIALQFLGFSLPRWGVDGLFGNETEMAVESFQKEYNLDVDGILNEDDLKTLFVSLLLNDFNEQDLTTIQKTSDFSKINIGSDKDFYIAVLKGIDAPVTEENLKFLFAWRKAEGGNATNNPFNTTFKLNKDSDMSNYNSVGVKNYSTPNYGIEATVKSLLLNYYTCIVNGLRNDIGADRISECDSLKTWGTGDLVSIVLNKGNVSPPKIYNV